VGIRNGAILLKLQGESLAKSTAPHGCGGIAQAGWREQTGCLRPEAESPYLQK
jgi:hypothetical protein